MSEVQPRRFGGAFRALEALSHLAAIVAIAMIWSQMRNDAATKRSEISLDFVRQYNSDPISGHRQNIERLWLNYRTDVVRIQEAEGVERREIDLLVRHIVEEYDQRHLASPSILSIQELTSFFDQLTICIEAHACDRDILKRYFSEYAQEFLHTYRGIIVQMRSSVSAQIGVGLEKFVAEAQR